MNKIVSFLLPKIRSKMKFESDEHSRELLRYFLRSLRNEQDLSEEEMSLILAELYDSYTVQSVAYKQHLSMILDLMFREVNKLQFLLHYTQEFLALTDSNKLIVYRHILALLDTNRFNDSTDYFSKLRLVSIMYECRPDDSLETQKNYPYMLDIALEAINNNIYQGSTFIRRFFSEQSYDLIQPQMFKYILDYAVKSDRSYLPTIREKIINSSSKYKLELLSELDTRITAEHEKSEELKQRLNNDMQALYKALSSPSSEVSRDSNDCCKKQGCSE